MEPVTTAAVVSGAANLIGGLFNRKSTQNSNEANIRWEREKQQRDEALQREFAQNGIRWRVEDAKAAGLHPLYAVGASGASYSPSSSSVNLQPDYSLGDSLRGMGQDVSRAITAQQTAEERQRARLQDELLLAQIQRTYAERDEIMSRASRGQQIAMSYPVMPSNLAGIQVRELPSVTQATNGRVADQAGGPPQFSGQFRVKPQEVPTHSKSNPGRLPRNTPGYIMTTQPDGSEILVPAQGDQRMDEISAIDFWPWLRANLNHNPHFIGDYLLGPEMNNRLRWDNIKRSIASSWRTPLQRMQDFRR